MADAGAGSFDDAFADLASKSVRLAYRILGDRAAAEDIAADALVIALARWHRVADLPHRTAWVLRVTGNLALRAAKKAGRPTTVTDAAGREATEEFEDDVVLRLALVAALRTLPKRQRETIVLRYVGGLGEREVADILGVSTGTVKTHLHRGAQALRTRLGADFQKEGGLFVVAD